MDDPITTTTESTTPVTTPATTPAAPATVETPPTPATSQRPTSMLDALQQVAAREDAADAQPETAAIAQAPAADATGAPSAKEPGPIPFKEHKTILDNQRTKAAADAVAKVEAEIGWARQIPKESLDQMSTIARDMTADPLGFLERFVTELSANPQYAPQLRSQAARILGGRSAATPDLAPDVQIVDANGQVTGTTFSAERVQAIVQQAVQQAIGREVAPLKQAHERQQAEVSAKAESARIESHADAVLADAATWEGFTEHQPAIAAALTAHPTWTVERAYLDVFSKTIRPTLDRKAEQSVVQHFHKKAAGNTANGTGAAATPGKPRTQEDLRRTLESLSAGSA